MKKYLHFAEKPAGDKPEILLTLIDFSGSMDAEDYQPSRKTGAIQANIKLIQIKVRQYPKDRVGIIAFHDEACVLHAPVTLSDGTDSLCRSLRQYDDSGGTDFTKALKTAENVFFNQQYYAKQSIRSKISKLLSELLFEPSKDNHTRSARESSCPDNHISRRIILITDGEHNGGGSPVKAAACLKDAGVIIECIGIAGNRNGVNENMLQQIASVDENGNPRYCFIGDSESLLRKYEAMAHHIRAM